MAADSVRMSELAGLGIPGGGYTGVRWITTGLDLVVSDPEDDSPIAHVHTADAQEMSDAVGTVAAGLREPWELWRRRETLERAAALLREEHERIARIVSAESSKTITEARREASRAAETLRLSAAAAPLLEGETLPLSDSARGSGRIGWNRREPLGVVAAITPFNDPLNLVAHKVGPGLIAGNAIVLKPAATTPLSALALVDVLLRAGMPANRMAALVATRDASSALVSDPRVAAVSFTGGPATGDVLARLAGARKILMELGGNNAVVVCADADVAEAAAAVVDGAFGVAGQNCLSVQRVFAHESVYDELVARVVAGTGRLRVGSKRDAETDVGPLITEREARRVEEWVQEAVAAGAIVRSGGIRHGAFYEPTVLVDVPDDARVMREEVFGPVVSIMSFTDLDEALHRVDDTDFGMQAGVYTASLETALHAAERLHVGSVLINDTSDFRIDAMPFGGPKRSGVGREGVASAVRELSEPKNVIVNRIGIG
ncbi:aldehyde dehydrogenase family protein [Microbacterium sp.]|uniref:aldehyde dehydrogenase family protein n=1 Tax=Microbacterium sp. TaxID=51671 RepID=UPI0039E3076D